MADKTTFTQEGGNIVVFKNGKRISTGTPGSAKSQFGFTGKLEDGSTFQLPQDDTQITAPKIDTSQTTDITTPIIAPEITDTPTLPEPKANAVQESFLTSVSETAQKARGTVEEAYNREKEILDKKIEASETKITELTEKEELLLETDIEPLLSPFREELEKSERERLHINENFEANQKLTNELDQLLTEGNNLIRKEKSRFASRTSIARGTAKAIEDVSARAGVIQAVISARNGQINQAFTMINRTVDAINADRKDQLTYFQTILNFYEGQKGKEEDKIITLEKEQRDFIKKEIGLLQSDMKTAEKYAENIKDAMTDPDTALLYAQAGVKLNDSPEEIAKKISQATYSKEVRDLSNSMAVDGFTALTPGQPAPEGTAVVTITDSKGVKKQYYKKTRGSEVFDPSSTQIARGVAVSGFTFEEFSAFDDETQNTFINGDIAGSKRDIDDALETASIEDINASIDELGLTPVVAQFLKDYAEGNVPEEVPLEEETASLVTFYKDQEFTKKEALEATLADYKEIYGDVLPKVVEDAIKDAIDEVYGSGFLKKVGETLLKSRTFKPIGF